MDEDEDREEMMINRITDYDGGFQEKQENR